MVFGEAAALCIQEQHQHHRLASQNLYTSIEDRNLVSGRNLSSEDVSPRQLKHMHANNLREIPGNYHGVAMSGDCLVMTSFYMKTSVWLMLT